MNKFDGSNTHSQTVTMQITDGLAVYTFNKNVKLLSAVASGNNGENIKGYGYRNYDYTFFAYVSQWHTVIQSGNINITLTWQE